MSLFLLGDPLCLLFLVVQGSQHYSMSHLILGGPAGLVLQASQVILASLVFLEQNQVSQEYQLLLEAQEDQEILVAQGDLSCLHRLPLVCPRDLGDQVVQHPLFLHSGQGILGPLVGL